MTTQLPQQQPGNASLIRQHLAQQQTLPYQAIKLPVTPDPVTSSVPSLTEVLEESPEQATPSSAITKKQSIIRIATIIMIGILGLSIYFIWHPSTPTTPAPTITQFSTGSSVQKGQVTATTNGTIQVYIVGAVRHPGIYTLASNARLYQLLQQAGGPLSNANMVQLNLAERLVDGQEVYIAVIDETPPVVPAHSSTGITTARSSGTTSTTTGATSSLTPGQLININTASSEELRQGLHISSKTAEAIITYRVQQGSFTSVEQLLQVVSKTIYNKIKGQVTVA